MADRSILIVGASRGIGLGLAQEFVARGWKVFATQRSESVALRKTADDHATAIDILTCDVTDADSFAGFQSGFGDGSLDAVIVNAGITGAEHQSAAQATAEDVAHVMMTNAFGPVALAETLLPALRDGGTLAFMSSLMGSIDDSSGGYDLYRTSKAAQNMLAKGLSESRAKDRNIEVLSLHPGWVQTDMGGPNAKLTVADSVKGLVDVMENAGGGGYRFVDYSGKKLAF